MLSSTHAIKVIDFGLVVRAANNPYNRAGSKAYMAPEVILYKCIKENQRTIGRKKHFLYRR